MTRTLISATFLSAAMLSVAHAQTIGTATTDLNIRSGPGPEHAVIGMIGDNQRATVLGCIEGSRWCQVDFRGQRGWAYSQYMTLTGDAVALLQVPEIEIAPAARTTVAVAPAPLPPAPFAPLVVPVPVPVPTPVATWQPPAPVAAPAPVYAATTPPPAVTYRAPAPTVTYRAPAPTVAYRSPAPVVTYRAPTATTTVVETTAAAPREFVGRLTAPREVIYAATTPPRAYMPPRSVRTFISMNPLDTVWLEGSLIVGAGIPDDIDLIPVPGSRYNYAYVNDYPVLVDPASRRIVYVSR